MSKKIIRLSAFAVVLIFIASSCLKVDQKDMGAAEQDLIDNFIGANPTLLFQKKESGLYYYELKAGAGLQPSIHDTAYVVYTGKFLGGYVFDSNVGEDTASFALGDSSIIAGFAESVSYMKEGGKSISLIPSVLAYGPYGRPPFIPGYAPLLYEIELT